MHMLLATITAWTMELMLLSDVNVFLLRNAELLIEVLDFWSMKSLTVTHPVTVVVEQGTALCFL